MKKIKQATKGQGLICPVCGKLLYSRNIQDGCYRFWCDNCQLLTQEGDVIELAVSLRYLREFIRHRNR